MSLVAGLDLLQQGLAGVCPDEATGYALDNAARVLLLSAKASDDILSDATKRELTEKVTALAQQLVLLDQSLAGAPLTAPGRVLHVYAACTAFYACVTIGRRLDLQPSDAFRLAAATRLVINAGAMALEAERYAPQDVPYAVSLGERAAEQLAVVEAVLGAIL